MPFGGLCFVIMGDGRQVIPVVPPHRGQVVGATIMRSSLWEYFQPNIYELEVDMRDECERFADARYVTLLLEE